MSKETGRPTQSRQIIGVQGYNGREYFLLAQDPETNPLRIAAQIVYMERGPDAEHRCILETNDPLVAMWCSPTGNLWLCGATGNIWTTAPVSWPAADAGIQFEVIESSLNWNLTSLPERSHTGALPSATAIWGTSDSDVHVATSGGVLYHWNGIAWRRTATGVVSRLNHLHGSGKNDVYCVGHDATILYYNGYGWARVRTTHDVPANEIFTGVRTRNPNEVYVCGRGGTVMSGGGRIFDLLTQQKATFHSIADHDGRLLLAGGSEGVWELQSGQAKAIKPNVDAVGIFESGPVVYVVEARQDSGPAVIEYDPGNRQPWSKILF